MKHEDYREMISFYIDDLLSENEKLEFEAHMESCPECKEELEEMKLLISSLSEMEEMELPQGFEKELEAKLLNAKTEMNAPILLDSVRNNKKKTNKFKWKYIYSTAAALMLVVAGTAYLNSEMHFTDQAAKNAAPVAMYSMDAQSPTAAAYGVSPTVGGAASKMASPTEGLELGGNKGKSETADMSGSNTGNTNKNSNTVGAGTNEKSGNSGGANSENKGLTGTERSLLPTTSAVTTPEVTPSYDATYSMMKTVQKEIWTGNIKIKGDDGKYQPWAEKIIKESGGSLIGVVKNDVGQRFEYDVTLENFWTIYDGLTDIDRAKSTLGVESLEIIKTDETLDKTEEYKALEKTAQENSEAGVAAVKKLKELENALLKAKIVITIQK